MILEQKGEPAYISRTLKAQWAAEAWRRQYEKTESWEEGPRVFGLDPAPRKEKYAALKALGPHPDPDAVDEIIGNNSWTFIYCDECKRDVEEAVLIGGSDEYGEDRICGDCLRAGLRALELKGASAGPG